MNNQETYSVNPISEDVETFWKKNVQSNSNAPLGWGSTDLDAHHHSEAEYRQELDSGTIGDTQYSASVEMDGNHDVHIVVEQTTDGATTTSVFDLDDVKDKTLKELYEETLEPLQLNDEAVQAQWKKICEEKAEKMNIKVGEMVKDFLTNPFAFAIFKAMEIMADKLQESVDKEKAGKYEPLSNEQKPTSIELKGDGNTKKLIIPEEVANEMRSPLTAEQHIQRVLYAFQHELHVNSPLNSKERQDTKEAFDFLEARLKMQRSGGEPIRLSELVNAYKLKYGYEMEDKVPYEVRLLKPKEPVMTNEKIPFEPYVSQIPASSRVRVENNVLTAPMSVAQEMKNPEIAKTYAMDLKNELTHQLNNPSLSESERKNTSIALRYLNKTEEKGILFEAKHILYARLIQHGIFEPKEPSVRLEDEKADKYTQMKDEKEKQKTNYAQKTKDKDKEDLKI